MDVITEELMANAARMAAYIRSNLTLPNCTINDDIAALEIDWVDGPAQLPPDALHLLDEAFHFFGLACEIRRTLSAVVFGAAAIHQHVHGQHDGPAALLSATCAAVRDRDWFTDTPYGRRRTRQAAALRERAGVPAWGVVDPNSPADFGIAMIDALITVDAHRIDDVLGIGLGPAGPVSDNEGMGGSSSDPSSDPWSDPSARLGQAGSGRRLLPHVRRLGATSTDAETLRRLGGLAVRWRLVDASSTPNRASGAKRGGLTHQRAPDSGSSL